MEMERQTNDVNEHPSNDECLRLGWDDATPNRCQSRLVGFDAWQREVDLPDVDFGDVLIHWFRIRPK